MSRNKNYTKGRRKEYAIRNKLLAQGYDIAQRSAGSHSPIDIYAINREKKLITLIQCKPEGFKSEKIEKELDWLNNVFKVEFKVC